jgi:hypothetical protein
MLRMVYICALQVDAGRRLRWISPCKRSAARGRTYTAYPQLRMELNCYAVPGERVRCIKKKICNFSVQAEVTYPYSGTKENCTGGNEWYDCNACQSDCVGSES